MEFLMVWWPLLLGTAFIVVGITVLFVHYRARKLAGQAVPAAYRVALGVVAALGADAAEWLVSPAGAEFRKQVALRAYECIPAQVGPVPVGIVKMWVSQERFCEMVEAAFAEMAELADGLRDELEVPSAG